MTCEIEQAMVAYFEAVVIVDDDDDSNDNDHDDDMGL
jgi:hypothetical protein